MRSAKLSTTGRKFAACKRIVNKSPARLRTRAQAHSAATHESASAAEQTTRRGAQHVERSDVDATGIAPASQLRKWSKCILLATTVLVALACCAPSAIAAQAPPPVPPAWALTASTLALALALPGLAMFQAGLLRTGSVNTLLLHHIVTAAAVSLLWVCGGFSAVASTQGMTPGRIDLRGVIGKLDTAWLKGLLDSALSQSVPQLLRAAFSLVPAILAPCIAISAAAERAKPFAMVVFSALWVPCVYIPVLHAAAAGPGGLIFDLGVFDGAGNLALNVAPGFTAFALAVCVGKRRDRAAAVGAGSSGEPHRGHNLPTAVLGLALFAVGWLALIAGTAASGAEAVSAVIGAQVTTSASTLTWVLLDMIFGKLSLVGACFGAVTGLVVATAVAEVAGLHGALAAGSAGAIIVRWAIHALQPRLRFDDVLNAFALHGVAGTCGALFAAVTAQSSVGGFQHVFLLKTQLSVQAVACSMVALWSLLATLVLANVVRVLCGGFTVDADIESAGTDLLLRETDAYSAL